MTQSEEKNQIHRKFMEIACICVDVLMFQNVQKSSTATLRHNKITSVSQLAAPYFYYRYLLLS